MELGEIHTQTPVLEDRQDSVAGILVEWQPAFDGPPYASLRPRRPRRDNRMIDVRQNLRSVLAVSVKQDHHVEAFVHEVLIAGFLISAVPQVLRVGHHSEFIERPQSFTPTANS